MEQRAHPDQEPGAGIYRLVFSAEDGADSETYEFKAAGYYRALEFARAHCSGRPFQIWSGTDKLCEVRHGRSDVWEIVP